ncbi:dephospho-CoA kinase [Enemella evansiae]|uniref:Dephospho-CoA kinase n=1 Tax=Enemella evansiae TaxID=2016499 RepID=A0A255GNS2_9ACTN|nr:dephospho-CoA kinase [Enemella evansiae]OYN93031.1 dephospho-CoA kinase [Enemella evansiae]OYN95925.1 dephospho-CoA kinase [Enemella evansiae]OYO04137.1 dephospho-CoA kinase [Enemella evansiae]OYO06960.1 dephospho-CoA kinase [Enemella evansiae]OYO08512.1 dephospho-CoA kinase [Enemella evansiae]
MLRVALTGGLASGKTTVAERWAEHGAVLIDSDVLAREVVEPGTPGLAAVRERFGDRVLAADGSLDRKALGAVVFADSQARKDLEGILHPLIRARAAELQQAAAPEAIVVQVIPLLAETGRTEGFDAIVVVDLPTETQLRRAMARDGSSAEQAGARIEAQAGRTERLAVADLVVDNSGDREQLLAEADRVWHELRRRVALAAD